MPRTAASLFVLAAAAAAPAAAAQLDPMPLVAHRAVYDLKLSASSSAKAPSDARGRIAFDFTGSACDGYVMNFRQVTELTPAEGTTRVSDMRTATFEDGDGKSYRFKAQSTTDGSKEEDSDGRATVAGDGGVSLDIAKPLKRKADIGQGIMFPTDHIRHIVAAAKEGRTTMAQKLFDGSENGEKVFDTLTVIGKQVERKADEPAAQLPQLEGMARWPVAISYFTQGKAGDAPDYVLSFDLYENGISRALKLDYGDFVLAGRMETLELLPAAAPCGK